MHDRSEGLGRRDGVLRVGNPSCEPIEIFEQCRMEALAKFGGRKGQHLSETADAHVGKPLHHIVRKVCGGERHRREILPPCPGQHLRGKRRLGDSQAHIVAKFPTQRCHLFADDVEAAEETKAAPHFEPQSVRLGEAHVRGEAQGHLCEQAKSRALGIGVASQWHQFGADAHRRRQRCAGHDRGCSGDMVRRDHLTVFDQRRGDIGCLACELAKAHFETQVREVRAQPELASRRRAAKMPTPK